MMASGPEGRKNLAHGVSRGYAVRRSINHKVAKDSSENRSPLRGWVDPPSIVHALAGLLLISISRPPWTEHVAAGFQPAFKFK
jgi:hypothetical protein